MGHVDALSRNDFDCDGMVTTIESEDIDFQLHAVQSRDREICDLKVKLESDNLPDFEMVNGVVYRKDSGGLRLYVPREMEVEFIRHIHEQIGHLGTEKCYLKMKNNYWFPRMKQKINDFGKNCIKCIMYSTPQRSGSGRLHSIPKQPRPFHTIHLDHLGPLPSLQSKRKHILLVVDAFTKFTKLYPVLTTSTKEVNAALTKYFDYYSRPVRCITDRGSCFTSGEFRDFMVGNNIDHVRVAVHSPQANGQVERVNRTLIGMLAKYSEPVAQADWARQLGKIEFALNNTVNRSTGVTPSTALFGVDQRGEIVDRISEFLDENFSARGGDIKDIRGRAELNIIKSQRYNEGRALGRVNRVGSFEKGDFVVIRNIDTSIGVNKKLLPKYKGPYVVHKVLPNDRYVIRDIENCQITQIPYDGIIEACNIRLWKKNLDHGEKDSSS